MKQILDHVGLPYWIDLFNEGIPAPTQTVLSEYTRRLWRDYVKSYGSRKTVGFSIIAGDPERLDSLCHIFGTATPAAFDLHIYEEPLAVTKMAVAKLRTMGFGDISWIIGETYYNCHRQATELFEALSLAKQDVLFLLQWPLTKKRACGDVDIAAPLSFENYIASGF